MPMTRITASIGPATYNIVSRAPWLASDSSAIRHFLAKTLDPLRLAGDLDEAQPKPLLVDDDNLAASNQHAVDTDIQRCPGAAVELDHRTAPEVYHLANGNLRSSQFDGEAHRNVEHEVQPPGFCSRPAGLHGALRHRVPKARLARGSRT